MAGLPAALALVPWGLLIEKVPSIASGAADLYNRVRGREAVAPPVTAADDPLAAISALEARIAALESEMQGSTRLIADLAAANAALLTAAERARRATLAGGITAVVALVAAAIALIA